MEAVLGRLPAAALCWPAAALAAAPGKPEAVAEGSRGLCFPERPRDGEAVMTKDLMPSPGMRSSPNLSLLE